MKLTFFGATKTTTGSRHLLEVNGQRILLECGMYQGKRAESIGRNSRLEFDAGSVNAMALSHAHIDHSGVIPVLTKSGYTGSIFCTAPTLDLCSVMLIDSAHIQEQDAEFISRRNAKKGLPSVDPIYRQDDARSALKQFSEVRYNVPTPIADGVTATWVDAGHLLGSAGILLDLQEKGRRVRLGFSGDIGRPQNALLPDPVPMTDLDYLLVESTYGGRDHEDLANVNQRVCQIVNRAVDRKGKIIIPAFAVSRVQQILYTLAQISETSCIPSLPIYVDSPLAVNATEIFERHLECFNPRFQHWLRHNGNPFSRMNITYVRDVEESKKLNEIKESCIIMSASGMAEAGRIRHHLKNNISDDRNTILIVGYCPPDTLGGRLIARAPEVSIFGEPHQVKARVEVIDAFSGHADRKELCEYVRETTGNLNAGFVVHGEEDQAIAMAENIRKLKPGTNVVIPNYRDSVEL